MKTFNLFNSIFIFSLIAICLISCSDDKEGGNTEITIEPLGDSYEYFYQGITFKSSAGSETIEFSCNGDWTLSVASTSGGVTWCTASAQSGRAGNNKVTVSVTENEGYDDRSVTLTLQAGTISKKIVITQKQKDAILLTSNKFELNNQGGSIQVEVQANIDYEVEISESAQNWIDQLGTRALSNNTLTFDIATNEDYEKREGEIYFRSGEIEEIVHVYQSGGGIIMLTQNEYPVSDEGETITVELKSNCDFKVNMPTVDWITEAPATKAMSSHTLYYVISPNDTYDNRKAEIIFSDKNNAQVTDTLKVIQMQKDAIIIAKDTFRIEEEGGYFDVELKTNIEYKVDIPKTYSWIEQVTTKGLADHTLRFSVKELTSKKPRTGIINITSSDGELNSKITVIQQLKDISTLNLHVEEPGTLKDLFDSSRKYDVKNLTLSGELNGTDLALIRSMKLDLLDFSNANIVEGGESYFKSLYSGEYGTYFYTKNDTITPYLFHQSKIKNIILPNSITHISYHAFSSNKVLESIIINGDVKKIERYAFGSCWSLNEIHLPENLVSIGEYAFYRCDKMQTIQLPKKLKVISDGVFYQCYSLTEIDLPESLDSIGSGAFSECTSLKSIAIPEGITMISVALFDECSNLTSVKLPHTIKYIDNLAFSECPNLQSFEIPEGVIYIGTGAFSNCGFAKRKPVTIPASVKYLGWFIFDYKIYWAGCLPTELHFKSTTPPVYASLDGDGSLNTSDYLTNLAAGQNSDKMTLYVPKGCKEIYRNTIKQGVVWWKIIEE